MIGARVRAATLAAFLLLDAGAARALPLVQARISPPVATVGDRVEVVLTLSRTGPLPTPPHFPVWNKRWGKAEILETGAMESVAGPDGPIYRQRLVLSSFETGRIDLPPTALRLPTASGDIPVYTPSALALDIRSVLPPAAKVKDPKPKPAAPLRSLPFGSAVWWTLGAFATACALILWADLRRRRRLAQTAGAAPRPLLQPLEELFQALGVAQESPSAIESHTRLSQALRRYLGRRLPFPALESTTSEVQRQLSARRVPSTMVTRLVELLRACDLVKFARRPVEAEETRRRCDAARGLAQELEGHFAPPAPTPMAPARALQGTAR